MKWTVGILLVALYLSTSRTVVGPSSVAYCRLFGKVVSPDVPPGLRCLGPWTFFEINKWPVREVEALVSATPYQFVAGEINVMLLTRNIQDLVNDPYPYHYRMENPQQIITEVLKDEFARPYRFGTWTVSST